LTAVTTGEYWLPQMAKTTIQIEKGTADKLKRIKKLTKLPLGKLADIGFDYLEPKILGGELVAQNGKLVTAEAGAQ
jgi:hypothetical protein